MIIATAGHVDHGKTSLVLALTQTHTDSTAEEQRRGMTIDLGFAYSHLAGPVLHGVDSSTTPLGFVDVPGHERFVRNMLAGVAAIDLALLVVAADDGPMPQTHEHLAILGLLGVPRCVVVLSKIDRVPPDRLAQARQEIGALLAPGPYAQAPVFAVAAPSGAGLPALRQHLLGASRALAARPATGWFRLAVDRSFLRPGAGRIVTGAVLSGAVQVGDVLTVSPQGSSARVRGLHAQNRPASQAQAGQRCALNLVGLDGRHAAPARGDWVLASAAHRPTQRIDVALRVLASAGRPLAHRAALQLHIGAAAVPARLAVLGSGAIAPGASGLAQLVLAAPVAALHGDRFILRDAAANHTLAGGQVVDPFGPVRGRSRPVRVAQLAALACPAPAQALAALLAIEPAGVDLARFALARNLPPDEAGPALAAVPMQRIAADNGPLGLAPGHWSALAERALAALAAWHVAQPASLGAPAAALAVWMKDGLPDGLPDGLRDRRPDGQRDGRPDGQRDGVPHRQPGAATQRPLLHAALAALVTAGSVQRDGLCYRLAGHRPLLGPADSDLLARLADLLRPAGLRPPIVGALATQLGLPLPALLDFLARLQPMGVLVRLAPNRFYLPETVADLAAQARQLAQASGAAGFDAAAYRDHTGIGRNLTVQVLEFLDREGLTRFDGQRRRWVG